MAIQDTNNPYEIELNRDINGNPITVAIYDEPHTIYDSQIVLAQIPSESATYRVLITGMTEININSEITLATQFKVDYKNGVIYFDPTLEGTSKIIHLYYGRGIKQLHDTRVKLTDENNYWDATTLKQLIDEIAQNYRTTQYLDPNTPDTIVSQNVRLIICEEGNTIPAGSLPLGTIVVVK